MPVLMLGLMLAPALMMRYASGQTKTIVVIDRSGLVAQHLESSDEVRFETSDLPVDTALRVMIDKFGVLYIGADVLANPSDVKLYANSASSMMLEENLRGQIAKVLEREKLRAYRIEDLDRILADVKTTSRCRSSATTRVRLRPVRRPSPQWWGWGSAWCSTCS